MYYTPMEWPSVAYQVANLQCARQAEKLCVYVEQQTWVNSLQNPNFLILVLVLS